TRHEARRLVKKPKRPAGSLPQGPHRPGTAPALGLRAGKGCRHYAPADRSGKGETLMWYSSVLRCRNSGQSSMQGGAGRRCRPLVEALGERLVPSFAPAAPVAVGDEPFSVAVGDFNGDGRQDLAVANANSGSVSIRLGDGAGGFSPAPDVAAGSFPVSVAVGDFNGDGRPDPAVARFLWGGARAPAAAGR